MSGLFSKKKEIVKQEVKYINKKYWWVSIITEQQCIDIAGLSTLKRADSLLHEIFSNMEKNKKIEINQDRKDTNGKILKKRIWIIPNKIVYVKCKEYFNKEVKKDGKNNTTN